MFLLDPLVQIVIDESRNILYSRSEKGVIQVIIVFVFTRVCVCVHYVFVCVFNLKIMYVDYFSKWPSA